MSPEEKISTVVAVLLAGITVQFNDTRFKFFSKGAHVPNRCEYYAIPECGIYLLSRVTTSRKGLGRFQFDFVHTFPFRMNDFLNAIGEMDDAFIADKTNWALTGEAAFLAPPAGFDPEKDKYLPPEPKLEAL